MQIKKIATVICVAIAMSGCAVNQPQPGTMIDTFPTGLDRFKYERDKSECATLANQRSAAATAIDGALGGALIGAMFGAIVGGNNTGYGAALGAASGGVSGAAVGAAEKAGIMRECLRGRGYHVLN